MITHNENGVENEKNSYRYDIRMPRSRYKKTLWLLLLTLEPPSDFKPGASGLNHQVSGLTTWTQI